MTRKIMSKYIAMQNDLRNIVDTGKMGNLTVSDFDSVCTCSRELVEHHATKTLIKNVADYFRGFGFMVTMDFDKINYVIVEA